ALQLLLDFQDVFQHYLKENLRLLVPDANQNTQKKSANLVRQHAKHFTDVWTAKSPSIILNVINAYI
ncbi:MAG: hypothetical protein WBO44_06860, partial [Saprospiraceae bacterium]